MGLRDCFRPHQWQVLQDLVEQLVQLEEEALIRLEPPPMPKQEIIFRGSAAPHSGQTMSLSLPMETRHSKCRPHFSQTYSYIGIVLLFYRNHRQCSIYAVKRGDYFCVIRSKGAGAIPAGGLWKRAEGIIGVSMSGDLAGRGRDEGSFRGNRQNVFELGVAHAERVVLAPSPAR
jgi:hypothetical protein